MSKTTITYNDITQITLIRFAAEFTAANPDVLLHELPDHKINLHLEKWIADCNLARHQASIKERFIDC